MGMVMTDTNDQTREAEVKAIKQVVATLEHSQQNELPDEFVSLFRPDAIWTTSGGKPLPVATRFAVFTHQVLPGGMKGLAATYEVVHVLFIRPDVAAVKVRQRYARLDGQPMENQNEGSPLYVMAKEDGQWRLVACQNTEVLDS
jgi:uncharacterized protein (TIGR02246 family)